MQIPAGQHTHHMLVQRFPVELAAMKAAVVADETPIPIKRARKKKKAASSARRPAAGR